MLKHHPCLAAIVVLRVVLQAVIMIAQATVWAHVKEHAGARVLAIVNGRVRQAVMIPVYRDVTVDAKADVTVDAKVIAGVIVKVVV